MEFVEKFAEILFALAGMAGFVRGGLFFLEKWRIEDAIMERLDESETGRMINSEDAKMGLGREEKKEILLLVISILCMIGMICIVYITGTGKSIAVFILGIFMYCTAKRRLKTIRGEWEEVME